jgi:hypothetical protein
MQPVVVLRGGDEGARAVRDEFAPPEASERLRGVVDDALDGVRPLGGVGEIADREGAGEGVGSEDVFGSGHGVGTSGMKEQRRKARAGGARGPPVQARAISKVRSGRR